MLAIGPAACGSGVVAAGNLDRADLVIDITATGVGKEGSANGHLVRDDGQVDGRVGAAVGITARGRAVGGVHVAFRPVQLGLVGDVTDQSRLRASAEQGALRALQDLDAFHVHQVDVVVVAGEGHRLIVEVQRHVRHRGDGRLGLAGGAAVAQAAHEDVAHARTVAAEGHVGRVLEQLIDGGDVQLLQLGGGCRLHRDGDVLQVFRLALRRNNNFFEPTPLVAPAVVSAASARGPMVAAAPAVPRMAKIARCIDWFEFK